MMKLLKYAFAIVLFCTVYTGAVARQVPAGKALKIAAQVAAREGQLRTTVAAPGMAAEEPELVHTAVAADSAALYYVFNARQGFVIVAGDDACLPVLGYSENGAYDPHRLPPNFVSWMQGMADEIAAVRAQGITADEVTAQAWDDVEQTDRLPRTAGSAQLLSTEWDQATPYNNECPMDGNTRSLTGCVATTMAQIMNYHQHPAMGTGVSPRYTTTTKKIVVPSVTFNVSYAWNRMNDRYGGNAPGASEAQKAAVATLMHHAGVTVKMNYAAEASGAYDIDVGTALTAYFDYDKSMQLLFRDYYPLGEWTAILKNEIDNGRPVYYSGTNVDGSSAHAFACDGYDADGRFHFNWGWSGSCDGYYAIGALNPYGANDPDYTFNRYSMALVGIKPNEGGKPSCSINLKRSSGLSAGKDKVMPGGSFSASACFENSGWYSMSGQGTYSIALVDAQDEIVTILATRTAQVLKPNSYFNDVFTYTCTVPGSTPYGHYYLRAVVKMPNDDEWQIARAWTGNIDRVSLQVGDKMTFRLNSGAAVTAFPTVTLDFALLGNYTPTHFMASEQPAIADTDWQPYTPEALTYTFAESAYGLKTVYIKLKDAAGKTTTVMSDDIYYKPLHPKVEDAQAFSATVYPNPVETAAQVALSLPAAGETVQVRVYGISGECFLSQTVTGSGTFNLDLSQCPSGILLLRIEHGTQAVVKRIIKK